MTTAESDDHTPPSPTDDDPASPTAGRTAGRAENSAESPADDATIIAPQHSAAGAAATRPSGPERERRRQVEQAAKIEDEPVTPAPDPKPLPVSGGTPD